MNRLNRPNFNARTGSRWALPSNMLPTGPGTALARQSLISALVTQMASARHSSTHFLQHGWKPAIAAGLKSEYYRYNPAFGSRRAAIAMENPLNTIPTESLGSLTIDLTGDDCVVTATNDVGSNVGKSNEVLAAKHREALIAYGTEPLQRAVDAEAAATNAEIERRFAIGMKVKFPELL